MNLSDEIQAAIQAHAMWKINLLKAIENGSTDIDPVDVRQDNLCAFGKWLFGESIPHEAKEMDEYTACVRLHKDFHEQTSGILALALNGQKHEALGALGEGRVYYELSATLIQYLKLWRAKWDQAHHGK